MPEAMLSAWSSCGRNGAFRRSGQLQILPVFRQLIEVVAAVDRCSSWRVMLTMYRHQRGLRLLDHLLARMDAASPHLMLNAHTLWAVGAGTGAPPDLAGQPVMGAAARRSRCLPRVPLAGSADRLTAAWVHPPRPDATTAPAEPPCVCGELGSLFLGVRSVDQGGCVTRSTLARSASTGPDHRFVVLLARCLVGE